MLVATEARAPLRTRETRRHYRPGLAYRPRPGSGFGSDARPPAEFTDDPAEHLAHIAHARDAQGWQRWELAARFTRPDDWPTP